MPNLEAVCLHSSAFPTAGGVKDGANEALIHICPSVGPADHKHCPRSIMGPSKHGLFGDSVAGDARGGFENECLLLERDKYAQLNSATLHVVRAWGWSGTGLNPSPPSFTATGDPNGRSNMYRRRIISASNWRVHDDSSPISTPCLSLYSLP